MCWWSWGGRFVLGYLCVTCASGSHPESPKTFLITYFVKMKVDILVGNISWQVQKNNRCDGKLTTKKKKNTNKDNPTHRVWNLFPTKKIMSNRNKSQAWTMPRISHLFSHLTDLFFTRPLGTPPCVCVHFQSHSFALGLPSSPTAWVVEWLPGSRVCIKASARPVCV